MATPVDYIALTRDIYSSEGFQPYRWVENAATVPLRALAKPLSRSRLGLIASGGIYRTGHTAFHFKDDASYRLIPKDVPAAELRTAHFAYDQTDARADPNCVFPIDPLRRLEAEGFIGELASQAITFMGGIYSARGVREALAPRIVEEMQRMAVDAALLVPV
ncbi:MAG: glycine/sarcosine/betaine reductase selenoprotein B family protein [Dehalococcoidia bacterium]